jgi:hypothetical protein
MWMHPYHRIAMPAPLPCSAAATVMALGRPSPWTCQATHGGDALHTGTRLWLEFLESKGSGSMAGSTRYRPTNIPEQAASSICFLTLGRDLKMPAHSTVQNGPFRRFRPNDRIKFWRARSHMHRRGQQ